MINPDWTKEEDNILKENYLNIKDGLQKIKLILSHRNYNGIKARSNFLGMKRHIPFTKDEMETLKDVSDSYDKYKYEKQETDENN